MSKKRTKSLGKLVNVRQKDGTIQKISWNEILENEEGIIEENIIFGSIHAGDFSKSEILDYEQKAKAELELLKKAVADNPDIVLTIQPHTQRYIPE